ncbi:MAG: carboxypeptidase-like regulatory domain-containing protein [Ignavibacteria bacterium]|nr:carboxypeptidase-like regulatory domain-containing protein [Ignavibacteria bacterium]
MRSTILAWVVAIGLIGLVTGCEDDNQSAVQGEAKIGGTVTDDATLAPIAGVSVRANSVSLGSKTTVTNDQGYYEFTFEVDSSATVELVFTKSGYNDKTETTTVNSATFLTLNVDVTAKSPIIGGGGSDGGSGIAQTIAFLSAEPQEVSVYGVGGLETALLEWEARDSLGLPIDAANAIDITFTIVGGPGGAEYISPRTVTTSALGKAFTTFNSGVRSGVAQVKASATVGGRTIETSPIRIVINAGFPDQAHFTVGPARHNFPSLLFVFGKRNPISVLVGDKYSNPVQPATALYFRSSAGVIQAAVHTDDDGQGSADLISGNPYPLGAAADPMAGDGYHFVVAHTIGESGVDVMDSTLILWSGFSEIKNITPTTFDIPNGGTQVITFNVSDYLGHPLSAGTIITVAATVPPPPCPDCPINTVGNSFGIDGSLTLDDYLVSGPGITDFSFVLSDGSTDINDPIGTTVTVRISVESENGDATTSFVGTLH